MFALRPAEKERELQLVGDSWRNLFTGSAKCEFRQQITAAPRRNLNALTLLYRTGPERKPHSTISLVANGEMLIKGKVAREEGEKAGVHKKQMPLKGRSSIKGGGVRKRVKGKLDDNYQLNLQSTL